jgi:hypothetical protein
MSSGLRFFRRVPILGRFVTLNLSKAGASAQDADLPPALLEMRATAIEALQTTFGYRVVREVPPAASQPSSTGNYVAIGLVVSVIAMALLATWWLS